MATGTARTDVLQGTLALMGLQTLRAMGPQHGYGIARRIEQVSGDLIAMNQGTLYPALVRLEQDGLIKAKWGVSENNRKAKFYALTRRGEKQLAAETARWSKAAQVIERFIHQRPAPGDKT